MRCPLDRAGGSRPFSMDWTRTAWNAYVSTPCKSRKSSTSPSVTCRRRSDATYGIRIDRLSSLSLILATSPEFRWLLRYVILGIKAMTDTMKSCYQQLNTFIDSYLATLQLILEETDDLELAEYVIDSVERIPRSLHEENVFAVVRSVLRDSHRSAELPTRLRIFRRPIHPVLPRE